MEQARPHLAVVEGFAGLLEQAVELVDGGEGQLHAIILRRRADGCTDHGAEAVGEVTPPAQTTLDRPATLVRPPARC